MAASALLHIFYLLLLFACCLGSLPAQHLETTSFEEAILTSDWAAAEAHARASPKADAALLLERFVLVERRMKEGLSSIKSVVESLKPMNEIVPALQWAQSPTHVFLNVKFAHIISAPATLNVVVNNVTFAARALFLEASDSKKLFKLELDFLHEIDQEGSSWSMASVGRMTFSIKKAAELPSKWKTLCQSLGLGAKGKGQQQLWYSMQEQHAKELDKLEAEEEAAEKSAKSSSSADKKRKEEKEGKEKDADGGQGEEAEEGKIVSPTEQEAKDKIKAKKIEMKASIAELERRAKQRKRDVDFDAVEKKKEIDRDMQEQLVRLQAEFRSWSSSPSSSAAAASPHGDL